MPKFMKGPSKKFEDVWIVNPDGRVVSVPGGYTEEEKDGEIVRSYNQPAVDYAVANSRGWRMATEEEIAAETAAMAARAEKDKKATAERKAAETEAATFIKAAKSVKKGKATE